MLDDLTKFLIELSADPAKRREFAADPYAMMKAAGLTAADQKLLMSGDSALVRARYGAPAVAHLTIIIPLQQIPDKMDQAAGKLDDLADDVRNLANSLRHWISQQPPPAKRKRPGKKK